MTFFSHAQYFNSHHTPVSSPTLLPLQPVLLSLFREHSSLESVILPLQSNCCCLSAQRNCLPAPNPEIKRVTKRDCPHLFQRWEAWTDGLPLKMGTYKWQQSQPRNQRLCWVCSSLTCISTHSLHILKFTFIQLYTFSRPNVGREYINTTLSCYHHIVFFNTSNRGGATLAFV